MPWITSVSTLLKSASRVLQISLCSLAVSGAFSLVYGRQSYARCLPVASRWSCCRTPLLRRRSLASSDR
eukprot:2918483-Pyramimonas_sp.AAC.1